MSEFKILSDSISEEIKSNVFSSVEIVNKNFSSSLIVDFFHCFATYIGIRLSSTGNEFVSRAVILSVIDAINYSLLKMGLSLKCRFIGVNFDCKVLSFTIDL